jgi:hypothetical protein
MCSASNSTPDPANSNAHPNAHLNAHPDDRASLARLTADARRRRTDRLILRAAIATAVLGYAVLIATLLFEHYYGPVCPPPPTQHGEHHVL